MKLHRINTIREYHQFRGLPKPEHPLLSLIHFEDIKNIREEEPESMVHDFYSIALKNNSNCTLKYGQREYDFDGGKMLFIAPNQVYSIRSNQGYTHTGWLLLFHPDFLWHTSLVSQIKQYEYFGYSVNEALHLSDKEEQTIIGILNNIEIEYRGNIDKFSKPLIISQIELLLNYSDRFYHRQFITREKENHEILIRLEKILEDYFNGEELKEKGLPAVVNIANDLNISPNYLSALLKILTGQSTQQHIHNKLIEKAKEKLSLTNLTVSEIAYELGFHYPQSFSKLFKAKTKQSPLEFRASFN